jgi:hypothetical protein
MTVMRKHGVAGYRAHGCRCDVCTKAYAKHLKAKRVRGVTARRLPSTTNTLEYDTMTRGQFDRLRG